MQGMGVKGLYMTPHIIHGAYDNRGEEELRQRFADFGDQGPLDIRLGAEYFIDDKFPEHLEGNPLTMNCRHVLVEFSINGYSLRAFDMLFEATLSGYEIILAHPERYAFVQANGKDKVINLIKQYKLQLNLLSLAGYHGSGAKKYAEQMLRQFSCSKLFFGVDGFDLNYGVTTTNLMGGHLALMMIETVQKVIALVDSSKFGRRGFCKMCDVDRIDMVITDDGVSPIVVEQLQEAGIDVRIVEVIRTTVP